MPQRIISYTLTHLITTLGVCGSLCAQEALAPPWRLAPLNPEYLEWQAKQMEKQAEAQAMQALGLMQTPKDNRFGYIPSPVQHQEIHGPATQIEAMVRTGMSTYSASYDLRQLGILSPIRNQNPFGTCWAFAAYASMESFLKKTTGATIDFSEWHLAWFTYNQLGNMPAYTKRSVGAGENTTFDQGGNSIRATAMLSRGTGPVLEENARYQNISSYPPSSVPTGTEPNAATLTNTFFLNTTDRDTIKGLVQTYGPVGISVLWPEGDNNSSYYYNSSTKSFRYVQSGTPTANHAVSIVGWMDDYPASSFPSANQPAANGAWIVRNSWSTLWGESGYYYQSYDTSFLNPCIYLGRLNSNSKIYQYDLLGLSRRLGIGGPTAWFSNVFTATGNDKVTDVAFYTNHENVAYEITIRTGVTGTPATGTAASGPQTGSIALPGYHRINLSTPVSVSSGTKFAVIVKLTEPTRPGNNYPIPILTPEAGYTDSHTSQNGVGYASSDGTDWSDIKSIPNLSLDNVSICLKAFAELGAPEPVSISLVAPATVVFTGEAVTYQADVTGTTNKSVAWQSTGGTIDAQGKFTAPTSVQTVTITATSIANTSEKVSQNVSILAHIDNCTSQSPQLLGIANAYGSTASADLNKYDLNGDGRIDDKDIEILFKGLGW